MSRIPPRALRLLPLIGSPVDGEALGACRAIVRTLAAVGLDLNDLTAAIPVEGVSAPSTASPCFFDLARACRDLDYGRLTVDEKRFVGDMIRLGRRPPTPKQIAWLERIYTKLTRRAA